MGGKGSPPPPPQIDPGKSMGEYLFGKSFGSAQGITDPVLQQRLLDAERTYRPQYAALELADIGTMARGLGEEEVADPRFTQTQDRISQLRAELARTPNTISITQTYGRGQKRTVRKANPKRAELEREIASQQSTLADLSPTKMQRATPGLFDLLEEQSSRAGDLQREQLGLQREADVGALQKFAPQVVDAYRDADPYSTGLAEQQTAMANDLYQRSQGLNPEQQRLADQQALSMSQSQGRVTDQSAVAGQLLGRENYLSGLRSQAAGMGQQAFNQNRMLAGDVGMTLLGRPSTSINLGGQMLGQAQQGAAGPMGPQLFDPNVGINMALQQRSQDVNYQGAMAQANAARGAGMMGAAGSIAGGMIAACWVAREVYGIENPKWLEFREWMLNDSPSWFRNLYLKYGERIAKFISNKPRVKSIIRKWMNTKIK